MATLHILYENSVSFKNNYLLSRFNDLNLLQIFNITLKVII